MIDSSLSVQELEVLRVIPTPAVSNAIETLDVRPRNAGYIGRGAADVPRIGARHRLRGDGVHRVCPKAWPRGTGVAGRLLALRRGQRSQAAGRRREGQSANSIQKELPDECCGIPT